MNTDGRANAGGRDLFSPLFGPMDDENNRAIAGIEMPMAEARGWPRYVQQLADEFGSVSITGNDGRIVAIVHALSTEQSHEG